MMNKLNILFSALALAFSFLLLACTEAEALNSSEESVKMVIPSFTQDSFGNTVAIEFWNVSYTDGINSGYRERLPSGSTLHAEVCKNSAAAFIAEPVFARTSRERQCSLYPAGAIYSLNKELSFGNGFAASVLYSMYKESSSENPEQVQEFLSLFNWQKFEQTCLEKTSNPWLLDKERIMKAISSGKFKKSDIRLR